MVANSPNLTARDARNYLQRDNQKTIWAVVAIIALAIIAYWSYETFFRTDVPVSARVSDSVNSATTGQQRTTGPAVSGAPTRE